MSIFEQLKAPFAPDRISWRIGSTTADKKRGMALAYLDARDVMDRLDEVCTPGGWQNRYSHANGKTVCDIGIKVGDEWIWKADGAGDTDVEAEKGALSDAFKRSAVRWGIGRYLYDVASTWVEIEPAGKSFRIPEAELVKLANRLGGGRLAKASAPAPAAKPVDNKSLDSQTMASDLIRELRKMMTTHGLHEWGEMMRGKIVALADADQERVRGEYAKQMRTLKENESKAA